MTKAQTPLPLPSYIELFNNVYYHQTAPGFDIEGVFFPVFGTSRAFVVESVVFFFSRVSLIILSWISLPVVIIMGQLKLNGSDVVTAIRIRAPSSSLAGKHPIGTPPTDNNTQE